MVSQSVKMNQSVKVSCNFPASTVRTHDVYDLGQTKIGQIWPKISADLNQDVGKKTS